MYDSKMIALFASLTPVERRRFKKWVASPIHNPNKVLVLFFDFLETRDGLTLRTLKRERAFAHLFGEQPYDDLTIRRTMSEFLDLLEDFLAYEHWHKDRVGRSLLLAQLYRDRQLAVPARGHLAEALELVETQQVRNASWHLNHYRVQDERFKQHSEREPVRNFQDLTNSLAHFFVTELLRNACGAASHSAIYKANYQVPFLDTILGRCAEGAFADIPLIQIYYRAHCCLTQPSQTEHFFALKSRLNEASQWLGLEESRSIFLVAINYCIRRANTDGHSFLREAFDLYREGLEKGVFLEHGQLSRFTFKNIAVAALALGELDWTARFIEKYAPFLPEAHRDSYRRFCTAKWCYQNKDYNQVQDLLQHLSSDDVFLELDARLLLLKVYMEQEAWRLLQGFLTTFERFVSRKKKLAYHAPLYRNIIHFAQRIAAWRSGKKILSEEELETLRNQIRETQPLSERDWLLRMIGC